MLFSIRSLGVVAALLAPVVCGAAPVVGPAGHWQGAIHAPSGDVEVAVDLTFDEAGQLVGTFSNPAAQIDGFPLWRAGADGQSVTLEIKTGGPGVQTFKGRLSADGESLAGDFLVSVYAVPFDLVRSGAARIAPPPRSPAIDAALVGAWTGSLEVDGQSLGVTLMMTNHADGTAIGSWVSDGAVATPITIARDGASIVLESTVTPAAYSGALSVDGTEIAGVFKEGAIEQRLTFKRTAAK